MAASPTGGVQDTSPLTWFASKSGSPKETAETLFDTSVSARATAVVCAGRSVTSPQLPLTGTASRRPQADPILPWPWLAACWRDTARRRPTPALLLTDTVRRWPQARPCRSWPWLLCAGEARGRPRSAEPFRAEVILPPRRGTARRIEGLGQDPAGSAREVSNSVTRLVMMSDHWSTCAASSPSWPPRRWLAPTGWSAGWTWFAAATSMACRHGPAR